MLIGIEEGMEIVMYEHNGKKTYLLGDRSTVRRWIERIAEPHSLTYVNKPATEVIKHGWDKATW